jgi:pimeloyl-ACP methyl ester carboxylesterase
MAPVRLLTARLGVGLVLALLVGACSVPVNVTRENPRAVARDLTSNVLTTGKPSLPTQNVLHRWDLIQRFEKDPEGAIAVLHQAVVEGRADAREVFAIAELCFKHAEDTKKREYYLESAVYAYAFLFPGSADTPPARLDPRLRVAADLYNRALTGGFASADGKTVDLRAGTYALPFGQLEVTMPEDAFLWHGRGLYYFVPVAELSVHGMEARYRRPGIGAPLAAKAWLSSEPTGPDIYVAKATRVAVTAFLRIENPRRSLADPLLHSTLEIHDGYQTTPLLIDGRSFPLEVEPTATLAWGLSESQVWSWELKGFLAGDLLSQQKTQLAFLRPYRPGLIPVVFIHGTASSPGRWADMVNDLEADPSIREHFQFWFFFYSTGNPIPYTAAKLRETLTEAVHAVDPEGKDPALREMVLIGHSQGGLLTKLAVVDPGDRFWNQISKTPFDQVNLSPKTRALLQSALFPKPLPFVRRVVFISTPHHGSYVAGWSLSHLVARFVRMPQDVLAATTDMMSGSSPFVVLKSGQGFSAVSGMTPRSPLIRILAPEPIVPDVHAHSIISVKGDGPVESGNDGVVQYSSAHIDGVDSEVVVRSPHSCQSKPETIAEVHRILLLTEGDACTRGVACPTVEESVPAARQAR